MIYPNTQPSGIAGGGVGLNNKKRLQQLLSRTGAAPMFGGSGKSASASDLPAVGAPALSFNPFLKMLANRPGETFQQMPDPNSQYGGNNPLQGFQGSSIPTSGGTAGSDPYAGQDSGMGHYNDHYVPPGTQPPAPGAAPAPTSPPPSGTGGGIHPGVQMFDTAQTSQGGGNPFYNALLQLAMYGQGR